MIKFLFPLFLLLPSVSLAVAVFDGYEEYYATMPGQLFRGEGNSVETGFMTDDPDTPVYFWSSKVSGKERHVKLRNGVITIDGKIINPFDSKSVRYFRGEAPSQDNFDGSALIWFSTDWMCLEGHPGNGKYGSRHSAVYLIKWKEKKPRAWILPSLFASCNGIRLQNDRIEFDKVEYHPKNDVDNATGLVFTTHSIINGKFVASGQKRHATFIERDNAWKFSIND
jgi:hypothetical protein